MKIRSLTLKNFRGFEDATLDLDRPLTVLFGVNGSGKSSVLQACAAALSRVFLEASRFDVHRKLQPFWIFPTTDTDVRLSASQLSVEASVSNGDLCENVHVIHPEPGNWASDALARPWSVCAGPRHLRLPG